MLHKTFCGLAHNSLISSLVISCFIHTVLIWSRTGQFLAFALLSIFLLQKMLLFSLLFWQTPTHMQYTVEVKRE